MTLHTVSKKTKPTKPDIPTIVFAHLTQQLGITIVHKKSIAFYLYIFTVNQIKIPVFCIV